MTLTEEQIAEMESEQIAKEDSYFEARHFSFDMPKNRHIFRAGFERGYKAALEKIANEDKLHS